MNGISEHSRRFSEDFRTLPQMSEDVPTTLSMTTFSVKRLFGLFSVIFNLIFVINHVIKNNSSGFVRREKLSLMREIDVSSPQAWELAGT